MGREELDDLEVEDRSQRNVITNSPLLALPGMVVITICLLVPVAWVLLVSFWSSKGFTIQRVFTLEQYSSLLSSSVFWKVLWSTLLTTFVTVAGSILIGFPVAYYIAKVCPPKWSTVVFLIAIIPFWTSYLTRMVTYIPLLGTKGLINDALLKLGIIHEPLAILLYSTTAQWIVMILLSALFSVGPIFFSLSKIDNSIMEAARSMGARPVQVFRDIILPLAKPGIIMGALFVVILTMQDYATASIIGGGKTQNLAGDVMQQAAILQWPQAAARAVALAAATVVIVAVLFRFVNLREEM
jgi:putative spermidine/putrescine transport system permease protein